MTVDLRFYWKLLLRRFPVMALFLLICSGLGIATAINQPAIYRTEARLLVEAPQIPDSMVASTIQTNAVEQLDIIQQRLLTRANLIDIANEFNVFEDIRSIDPDDVVAQMRASTRIRSSAGRDRATLMRISFTARSGRIAANVVNEYVTIVLEANSSFRSDRAQNTRRFFEQEVQRLTSEMDQLSVGIVQFKSENSDSLPENQSYRLNRQNLLQERLSRLERDLTLGQKQRNDIVRIFEATGRLSPGEQPARTRSATEQQLIVAQGELENLLSVYSETNPRVQRLQRRIERLEAITEAEARANLSTEDDTPIVSAEETQFRAILSEIDNRLQAQKGEFDQVEIELEELEVAISESASNGIELAGLERELGNLQRRFEVAEANLNEARMSELIESSAQGQRITEIESANVPRQPAGPNRVRIILMGVALGIGLAGAYFVLLEVLNRKVRRPAEMMSHFNISPLTTIPFMESSGARLVRRSGMVLASLVVLIGVPVALWYIDANYMPLELVVQKSLQKMGLS